MSAIRIYYEPHDEASLPTEPLGRCEPHHITLLAVLELGNDLLGVVDVEAKEVLV